MVVRKDALFIGGSWETPASTDVIDVVSPVSEDVIARVPAASPDDVDHAVERARDAFDHGDWPRLPATERAAAMQRVVEVYTRRLDEMAATITTEMGSPISFSTAAQAPAGQAVLGYYAALATEYPWEEVRQGLTGPVHVLREPVGVVAAIVPWNVPQFTIMNKLAPALAAGCTVVVKPAPESPLDAYLLAEFLDEAGLPPGVVSFLPAGREVGEYLVTHPGVDKVAFTGSTAAGRRIAALCGERLRRVSLELGGKSAAILLEDADLGAVADGLRFASFMNNGQACIAQSRVLAPRGRYREVVDALADLASSLVIGDPAQSETEIGPLVAARQRDRVEGYLQVAAEEGAKLVVGGGRPPGFDRGWYVEPTVFADVDNGMRIAREEVFGPVLVVIPYDGEEHAVELANDSEYGLAGSVWTGDPEHGLDVARRVRTGTYGVNHYTSDFAAPFGGYKASGLGRELGPEGLAQYVEYKSIVPSP